MKLSIEERTALVTIRLQRSKETLQDAKDIANMNLWRAASNRLYYACYYAVSALLIKNEFSPRTHAGVISLFNLHFVLKGLITEEQGKFYSKLFEIRQDGDYDDWVVIEAEDVLTRIAPAEKLITTIEKLISA